MVLSRYTAAIIIMLQIIRERVGIQVTLGTTAATIGIVVVKAGEAILITEPGVGVTDM